MGARGSGFDDRAEQVKGRSAGQESDSSPLPFKETVLRASACLNCRQRSRAIARRGACTNHDHRGSRSSGGGRLRPARPSPGSCHHSLWAPARHQRPRPHPEGREQQDRALRQGRLAHVRSARGGLDGRRYHDLPARTGRSRAAWQYDRG